MPDSRLAFCSWILVSSACAQLSSDDNKPRIYGPYDAPPRPPRAVNIQDPIEDYLKIYSESDPITFLAKFSVDLNGDGRKEIFLTNKASLEMPEEVKSGWLFYASSDDGYDRFGLVGLDINHTRVIQLDSYETPKGRKTFPGTVLLTYTIEHEAGGLPSAYAYYVEDGFAYHQKLGFVDDEEFLKRVYEVDPVEIEIIDVDK